MCDPYISPNFFDIHLNITFPISIYLLIHLLIKIFCSVSSSRATSLHPEWRWWYADTNPLHWDGHSPEGRRWAGMERVCQVNNQTLFFIPVTFMLLKKKKKVYSCSAFRWRFGNHLVGSPNKELWKWSHIWSIFMESVLKTWSFGCVGVQNMHIRRLAWWDTKYTTGMNVSIVTSVLTVY